MGPPTLPGFIAWIRAIMGIQTKYLPDDWPAIPWALNTALATVNKLLQIIPGPPGTCDLIYTQAVYNLAGDYLVNWSPDVTTDETTDQPIWYIQPDLTSDPPIPGQGYFQFLRNKWNLDGFVAGVVNASGDVSTNVSFTIPKGMEELTFADLQNLKTPWGRRYLELAQQVGTAWGIS